MSKREETKALLRDWMTSTCQLEKAMTRHSISDITFSWRKSFPDIKMTDKWVEKALYGRKKK